MRKAFQFILLILHLQMFYALGQPNAINIEAINEMEPSDYPIYLDKNIPFDINTLTKQNLDLIFNLTLNDITKSEETSFWIAINTKNKQTNDIIKIYAPQAHEVKAYEIRFGEPYKQLKCSNHRNDFHIIKISSKANLILVNIKSTTPKQLSIKSFSEREFFLKERKLNLYYGFIIGVFILLCLYHLVILIKVKDRLYLYYIILIIISGLLVIPHSGFILANTHFYYNIVFTVFQISCMLIAVNYLNIYEEKRRFIQIFTTSILILNIYEIIVSSILGKFLSHISCISVYLFILFSTWQQIKAKKSQAIWFFFPWLTLFVAHLFYLLNFEIILFYRQPIELGLFANICLMALAIGNKLKIYKDQQKEAESKELKAISERDKVIKEQNIILEQLIQERHKKVLEKNLVLSEKQKEIEEKNRIFNKTNHQLRTINQLLVNKNNEITAQNQELKKHHELLEIIVKKRTKKLLSARERAIVADKLKTYFLNNLTQEINGPMSTITGFASLLNNKDLTKEKRNEYLTNINKNIEILLESIDNVVVLARIQARILKPRIRDFLLRDLKTRFREVFSEKLKSLKKDNLKFIINDDCIAGETVLFSDYEKIWQILYKLTDNSIKFTEKGEVIVNYSLKAVDTNEQKYMFCLEIQDTGGGIEKEKLDYILERFSNNEEDKTALFHKTGIGLAIVKGLTDILNGKINVTSAIGKGTSFLVEIPVKIKPATS